MTHYKAGVQYKDMDQNIVKAVPIIDRVYTEITGKEVTITSARDGEHMSGSKHYDGKALDLRTRDISRDTAAKVTVKLQNNLGRDYDVVHEKDHIHVEYDPKA